MVLKKIDKDFSVCKITEAKIDMLKDDFCFLSKTDEELSLVCESAKVPNNVISKEDGFKAFRIEGILDFSLIGILAPIANILAENKIGIFAISTFNTDYVLVKKENYSKTLDLLSKNGYDIE